MSGQALEDQPRLESNVKASSRRAMVIIWSLTHLNELNRIAHLLRGADGWQPMVMLGTDAAATAQAKESWAREKVPYFVFQSEPLPQQPHWLARLSIWAAPAASHAVFALVVMLAVAIDAFLFLPVMCMHLLWHAKVKARTLKLWQRLHRKVPRALEPLAVAFIHPSWEIAQYALRRWPGHSLSSLPAWVLHRALHKLLRVDWLLTYPRHLNELRETLARARHLWALHKPDLVILAEDNVSYPTALFIKAARERGAASVIVPYTLASTREFVEGLSCYAHDVRRLCNRLVGHLYPHWRYVEGGRGILRLPAHHVLAMEKIGAAPRRPWIPNDGYWDALAVESPRMLDRYVGEFGMDASRLVLTGAMSDDTLFALRGQKQELKAALLRDLGLPAGRPLVLLAFPPNQFTAGRADVEFADYEEMARFLVETGRRLANCNLVITLHPRIGTRAKQYIKDLGATVCPRETVELVPLCDVYIASVSATIRWAIACGIPVINYDIFHYRYDDYDSAAGTLTIQSKSEWLRLLDDLNRGPDWIKTWSARQKACAARWGMLDGQSGKRLLKLFEQLTQQRAIARAGPNPAAFRTAA